MAQPQATPLQILTKPQALEEEDAQEPERESFEQLNAVRDIGLRLLNLDPEVNRPNESMVSLNSVCAST